MKRQLFAVLALLLLAGCASAPGPSPCPSGLSREKTFTSKQYRFAMTYDSATVNAATLLRPEGDLLVTFKFRRHFGAVWVQAGRSRTNVTEEHLRHLLRRTVHSYAPSIGRVTVQRSTVGGLDGYSAHGVIGKTFEYTTYAVANGRYVYIISPQAHPADWSKLDPTIDSIVGSFTVLS